MRTVCRARQGRHGGAGGFTLVELSVVLTILSIILGLLLPAVQRIQGAAAVLPRSNALRRSLIDWGDGTPNIQRDTALVLVAMTGNAPASGNAPSWQTVCSELGTSGATANSLGDASPDHAQRGAAPPALATPGAGNCPEELDGLGSWLKGLGRGDLLSRSQRALYPAVLGELPDLLRER